MAYADQQMSSNRIIALIIVALIHVVIGYTLITGLAFEAAKKVVERVTTVDVEEPPPPPPEEEPPPPEPQVDTAPPPPVAPPPPINVATSPPPIRTTQTFPPPAPVARVALPPAPAGPPPAPPPPAVSKARRVTAENQGRWAGQISSDYPPAALRREEQGVVSMQISVGPNGRVASCSVSGSSGSDALDTAACRGMQRYARYRPALNDAGEPIAASTTASIRYEIPD